jgi:hypothetical protein
MAQSILEYLRIRLKTRHLDFSISQKSVIIGMQSMPRIGRVTTFPVPRPSVGIEESAIT